jgi:2-C-methyl-D-erythritol 4-phosphate cytidylyltransferase
MNIAIILSGGVGSRMNMDIPKQYIEVNGKPIIGYCLETFLNNKNIDKIVITISNEWRLFVSEFLDRESLYSKCYFAEAGESRQHSIYNALKKIRALGASEDDVVIIHDAARPLVSQKLINDCLMKIKDADAIIPVIPVKDTTYYSKDGVKIDSLLNRTHLWAGQSPESFRFGKYFRVHEQSSYDELLSINGSMEIAYKSGLCCQMISGDPMNFKITTIEDLSNFESIIKM